MRSKRRKIWVHVAGEGESENSGQEPLGPQKKGPKKFLKKFFEKSIGKPFGTVVPKGFPILFSKFFSKKFLGPFFGTPGALDHYFRIPLLPLRVPIFFRRFDLISHFLLHGSAKGLNCRVQRSCLPEADHILLA